MISVIDEFQSYCLQPDVLLQVSKRSEGEFSQKLEELGLLYEAYLSVCANGSADPAGKLALLGDMLELGDYSYNAHYNLGKEVFQCGFRKLYTYGNYSKLIANGAIDAGMPREKIFINEDKNAPEISARQIANSYEDELILFKASHGMNAERIYGHLKNF